MGSSSSVARSRGSRAPFPIRRGPRAQPPGRSDGGGTVPLTLSLRPKSFLLCSRGVSNLPSGPQETRTCTRAESSVAVSQVSTPRAFPRHSQRRPRRFTGSCWSRRRGTARPACMEPGGTGRGDDPAHRGPGLHSSNSHNLHRGASVHPWMRNFSCYNDGQKMRDELCRRYAVQLHGSWFYLYFFYWGLTFL